MLVHKRYANGNIRRRKFQLRRSEKAFGKWELKFYDQIARDDREKENSMRPQQRPEGRQCWALPTAWMTSRYFGGIVADDARKVKRC